MVTRGVLGFYSYFHLARALQPSKLPGAPARSALGRIGTDTPSWLRPRF
jgi:hypothetical protein